MRRDYYSLTISEPDTSNQSPTIEITYEGPDEDLDSRLAPGNTDLGGDEIDITYRLQTEQTNAEEPDGVFAVTNRLTGEYIVEVNVSSDAIFEFVTTTEKTNRGGPAEAQYRLIIRVDDTIRLDATVSTLLVYDVDGRILKQHSLIPSGVEL